ncbi:PREDICTED: chromo domain-containing protein LHP1-like isoform X1 [Populus euphratica]|uniref:Chromo domain-containing protein LHP1-like isoform X1 n=1 Tax=Populus euphratica TaxID=75702 RepID=A0AAJ6XA72_POPEU|nr:PREDICTED: chromo domain-containing protein LHP1-like isoform X1 [Populus euphratica]
MKGKRKATANPVLADAEGSSNSLIETQVREGNIGEEKEINWVDNGENREETEGEGEEEEEEEDNDDDEEEEENPKGEDEKDNFFDEERTKLDEGFFEIEAIRRKRVRKGQLQYLIKWRGWPETANTWEPLENLQSCSDVIDAFEESLRSGRSSRKRKRKHGALHYPSKKKQPRSSAVYNVMDVEVSIADKHLPSAPLNNSLLADLPSPSQFIGLGHGGESNGDVNNIKTSKQTDENGSINGSKHIFERKEDNEYDPKLSELRGTIPNIDVNTNKFTIHFQEEKASEGNGIANGLPKVDYVDLVQNSRCTGAKKRKSGSVKRFKKDSVMCEPVFLPNSSGNFSVGSTGAAAQPGIENPSLTWGNSSHMPMTENSINAFAITKILKPIGFSASVLDDVQDVLITFRALRSDGQEVTVDNKFLKANNPHLLINFYEQHLKYST